VNYFGSLSKCERSVLISLEDLQGLNLYNICKYLGHPESTVKLSVRKLVSKGILTRTERGIFFTKLGNTIFSLIMGSSSNVRTTVSNDLFRKAQPKRKLGVTVNGGSTPFGPTKKECLK
jgi:predicted transcriptional regulator